MPKLDALALAAAIRALEGGERIYLVALTQRSDPEVTTILRGTGFNAHLVKPVDSDAFEEMLTAKDAECQQLVLSQYFCLNKEPTQVCV